MALLETSSTGLIIFSLLYYKKLLYLEIGIKFVILSIEFPPLAFDFTWIFFYIIEL